MEFRQIDATPVPVWLTMINVDTHRHRPPLAASDLWRTWPDLADCLFRGVALDRLQTILRTGIDVEPSDSVIYASDFDKAWEYGDYPKVVMALDSRKVQSSCLEVPADTPAAELAELANVYPTSVPRLDGESMWLSRLPPDDPRICTEYETEYAFWIPGDPLEALRAVFVFVPSDDQA